MKRASLITAGFAFLSATSMFDDGYGVVGYKGKRSRPGEPNNGKRAKIKAARAHNRKQRKK